MRERIVQYGTTHSDVHVEELDRVPLPDDDDDDVQWRVIIVFRRTLREECGRRRTPNQDNDGQTRKRLSSKCT